MFRSLFVPIHREGWPYVMGCALAAFIFGLFSISLGWIGAILTVWCMYFFRDPERITPVRSGLVISPADGVVQMITECPPPAELNMGHSNMTRISIFMSVFDCHVNRIPIEGKITKIWYYPGKFLNASFDKASELNERQALRIHLTHPNTDIAVVQIAGLVARRIVCDVAENQYLATGERFGMIRFGSRVDVYLPKGTAPLVALGQTTIAGETVLADFHSDETARTGECR